jgi:hypothetical protein
MTPLNSRYKNILWINVAILSIGVGFLVYKKFDNPVYGSMAGLGIGAVEYIFMRMSLGRKQQSEDERENNRK